MVSRKIDSMLMVMFMEVNGNMVAEGYGTYTHTNGSKYVGDWINDK